MANAVLNAGLTAQALAEKGVWGNSSSKLPLRMKKLKKIWRWQRKYRRIKPIGQKR